MDHAISIAASNRKLVVLGSITNKDLFEEMGLPIEEKLRVYTEFFVIPFSISVGNFLLRLTKKLLSLLPYFKTFAFVKKAPAKKKLVPFNIELFRSRLPVFSYFLHDRKFELHIEW